MTPGAAVVAPPSDADFARFRDLVNREAGILLSPAKKALLVGRLARRLRELGMPSWRDYHALVLSDPAEQVRMLDAIATNETHFFREPRHWEHLTSAVLPRWRSEAEAGRRPRRVRVWSAACSSGEEPFTVAMVLLGAFPDGWSLEIVASDLSTKVLARAERATWPLDKSKEIPPDYLKAYMLRGVGDQEGLMRAGPELRSLIRFERRNLVLDPYPQGEFDLVFCRNVLIYFDRESKEKVIGGLIDKLAPEGLLFLGHAETLAGFTERARPVLPTVYARAEAAPARRAR